MYRRWLTRSENSVSTPCESDGEEMRLGFFAYPWDLMDEGPKEAIEVMASRCHSNAILVNSNYHHARLLRPRALGPKTLWLPGAVAAFEPDAPAMRPPA